MTVCFDFINEIKYGTCAQQEWRIAEMRALRFLSKSSNDASAGKLAAALKNTTVVQTNNINKRGVVFVVNFEWVQMPNSTFRFWHDLTLLLNGNGYHARLEQVPEKQIFGDGSDGKDGRFFPIFIRKVPVNKALLKNKTVLRNINKVPLMPGSSTQGMSKARPDRDEYYVLEKNSLVLSPREPEYFRTGGTPLSDAEPHYEQR
ncbi:hypothetical protein [Aureimonas ureilytica]|uniref:hypothetical protein n=1 Tax=Aureimonas ureilytica TaxID=401562 RepID=UPI0012DDCDCF|nr:hypothetical protein [Aureimonas ureilytica]